MSVEPEPQLGGVPAPPPAADTATPPPPELVDEPAAEPELECPAAAADVVVDVAAVGFTSGQKVRGLIDRVFNGPPPPDVASRTALKAVKWVHRLGWTNAVLALFPSLDDAEAWDAWLAYGVGIALNLMSDGVDVDQAGARAAGAEILSAVFYAGDE